MVTAEATRPTPDGPLTKEFFGVNGVVWVTAVAALYPVMIPITEPAANATIEDTPTFFRTRLNPEPIGLVRQRPV